MNLFSSQIHLALPYLGILVLMYFALTVNVIRNRWKHRVGLGSGQNSIMEQVIRIHGNFGEYVPFLSLILIVLEINKATPVFLHTYWILLILSRVAHAWGLWGSRSVSRGRTLGMTLTGVVMLGSSLMLFVQFFK
ncbi:hypothetical protein AZI87_15255 [Bdellovibrio bacteriovorus]|uniref:Glutathione S-transferase n=1 Tax=Bdellovibrio bacteriovorus TaxID=959 RepID=A0A162FWQ4_BDEBC|nr:MAPEG family protein [Bdellovibrio bacteriovorus]KYG62648.1 hypothetical protein AZI87_15255 [Bdellovibrio bacteriovorus]